MSHLTRLTMASCVLVTAGTVRAYDISVTLLGPLERTVDQAFFHSPNEVFPIQGDPLLIWAAIQNNGDEMVRLTGPGAFWLSGPLPLYQEYAYEYWHPDLADNDPLVYNNVGARALELDPGESFQAPIVKIWGFSYIHGNPPLMEMPIGTLGQVTGGQTAFWDGFDADPNDGTGPPPDIYLSFSGAFTVTVVPEPGTASFLLAFLLLSSKRTAKRRHMISQAA